MCTEQWRKQANDGSASECSDTESRAGAPDPYRASQARVASLTCIQVRCCREAPALLSPLGFAFGWNAAKRGTACLAFDGTFTPLLCSWAAAGLACDLSVPCGEAAQSVQCPFTACPGLISLMVFAEHGKAGRKVAAPSLVSSVPCVHASFSKALHDNPHGCHGQ